MTSELCSPASERGVISSVLNYGGKAFDEVSDLVSVGSFELQSNQILYKCLQHICKDGFEGRVDLPSILSAAKSLGIEEYLRGDELKYLKSLFDLDVIPSSARKAAVKVEKLSIGRILKRQLAQSSLDLDKITGDEKISHIFGLIENPLFDLSSKLAGKGAYTPKKIGLGLREFIQHNLDNPVQQMGISTGFKEYDRAIGGGVRPKTINMVAARLKSGKSFFGDCVSVNIAGKQNIPVIMLDTEMGQAEHWARMTAMLSGIAIEEIETGKVLKSKQNKLFEAVDYLEKMPYDYLSISGQPFEDTMSVLRRWITKTVGLNADGIAKPCAIIYDYFKLMSAEGMSSSGLAEFQLLGFQATTFQNFMIKYSCGSMAFVQLNRDGITREDTDVISGSDRLGWLCSSLTLLKRQSEDEIADQPGPTRYNAKLVPLAQRYGAGLDQGDYINLKTDLTCGRITEGPTRNNAHRAQPKSGFEIKEDAKTV